MSITSAHVLFMIFHKARYILGVALGIGMFYMPLAFAYADTSISIQSLSPSTNVSVGTAVTFTISNSGFSNPTYALTDSASGSTASSGDINSAGTFSWTPGSSDVGTHTLTITVSDSAGDTATTQETLNVSAAPSLSIQSLSPSSSLTSGQTLTFTAQASGFTNPSYSISDSYNGSSVTSGDINSSGNFSWTPTTNDTGAHTLTITATDGYGHSASVSESIQVNGNANASIQGLSPGSTIIEGNPVTFTLAAPGFTNPVFSLQDSFSSGSGSTISNSDINSGGYFSWTPGANDLGTHTLTIYVNDSTGKNATIPLVLTVEIPSVSINDIQPSTTVVIGSSFTFLLSQVGFTNPIYTVSDSFSGTTLSNSDISSTGSLTWVPTQNDVGTHVITVHATDNNGHTATAPITIDVISPPVEVTTPTTPTVTTTTTTPSTAASSASTSGYVFSTYLYPGLTSPDVTVLQNILIQEGYLMVPATGYFGSLTQAAVEQFQAAHNLDQLGVVGPATRAVLNSLDGASTSSTQTSTTSTTSSSTTGDGYVFNNFLDIGSTGQDVTELQQRLTTLGDYSGPVTGYFGDLTAAAVEQFQGQHNIDQVGYVGPATRAALNQ